MRAKVFLLFTAFVFLSVVAHSQVITDRCRALRDKVGYFTGKNNYDSAQITLMGFLDLKPLDQGEVFYGNYLSGYILRTSGQPGQAIKLLLKSENDLKGLKHPAKFESLLYGSLAECYFSLQQYPEAKKYALLSVKACPDSSLRNGGHATNYSMIGYSFYEEKNYNKAIEYYNRAKYENDRNGGQRELPLLYTKIAKAYSDLGNEKMAKESIDLAVRISDSCGIEGYKLISIRTLFEIYKKNGNYKRALETLLEINDLVAKIERESKRKVLDELEVKYRMKLVERENDALKEISRRDEKILARQKFSLLLLISALVLFLFLIFLVIKSNIKRKNAEKKLVLINAELEKKVAERTEHLTEANQKITENTRQLNFQNKQLLDLCNVISHNLRGPFGNISGLVKFIEESNNEAERKMLIAKLKPVLANLDETFNELVESLQVRQDYEIKKEEVSLAGCLKRTEEDLSSMIEESKALIESNFEEAPSIIYPSKYLLSIFHNLLNNAIKYATPLRQPRIKIESKRVNGKIILSFKDNGIGIDLVKHGNDIFRIRKTFHEHPDAKGFGLYITKTQVETMGDKIWAESLPGKGSVFYIEFH
jgi:signal transduction histidine kinase